HHVGAGRTSLCRCGIGTGGKMAAAGEISRFAGDAEPRRCRRRTDTVDQKISLKKPVTTSRPIRKMMPMIQSSIFIARILLIERQ
ncbi:MAG TPA: hypothetical protein VFS17_03345, partial [Methylophilaceae bacterium]|nr:hypothetical protein [Methylophilaceae bacterium]